MDEKNISIGWLGLSTKRYGGHVYADQAMQILAKKFDVEFILFQPKYFKKLRCLKFLEKLYYLSRFRGKKNFWIRGPYEIMFLSKRRTKGKNLALIFHIDSHKNLIIFLLEKLFYLQLKRADAVITISEYWKNHFLQKGYKNVHKVYCGFDINEFNITPEEVFEFKKKYKLEGKPIIYLGNCHKTKGVIDSYNALRELDVYLVTSNERQAHVPTLNLNLDYRDYLKLLKASCLAVTMSQFKEGWSMTTHEAMLCKTPVIGSGKGGMKELLDGGKQTVCQNFKELTQKVKYLLEHENERKKMGEDGYNFAKQFTSDKFEENWLNLIKNIADKK